MQYTRHPFSNLGPWTLSLVSALFLLLGANALLFAASAAEQANQAQVASPTPVAEQIADAENPMSAAAKNDDDKPDVGPSKTKPKATETPAATTPASPTPAAAAATPSANQLTSVSASSAYTYVNNLRADEGLGSLTRNRTLEKSALAYAKKLANGCKDLVHSDLSKLLGINIGPGVTVAAAENLAYNPTLNGALNGLKNSSGHYANMVGNYSHIGIGAIEATNTTCAGRLYVVMQFARV